MTRTPVALSLILPAAPGRAANFAGNRPEGFGDEEAAVADERRRLDLPTCGLLFVLTPCVSPFHSHTAAAAATAMPSRAAELRQRAEAKRLWFRNKKHQCLLKQDGAITPEQVRG